MTCLCFLLGEEAEASPSIANTLWRVWTMFTRSAITPPEVNGFGWNLGNSEYTAWSCPWQILGAIRTEAAAGGGAEILFFFCPLNNAPFHRLPVGQISRNLHRKTCVSVSSVGGLENVCENLPVRGSFSPKTSILAWSKSTISDFRPRFLRNDYKSWKVMTGWHACGMLAFFHWHRWNELKVIPLACNPRTRRAIFFPKNTLLRRP